jgi:2-(1,2-epoxy-1,2-dihydrophenyl)acetyl-CoA isomerase
MSDLLHTQVEGGVMTLRFNRPDKFNSFVRELALAVQSALQEAESRPDVRCVVLTGQGKAFCAGQDLAEAIDPNGPPLQKIVSEHYNPIIRQIRNLNKPVVAAVNGVAAGAGANMALACDVVLAAESASFIQAFSKIGLIPDSGGTYFLPRLVGFGKALAMAMLGDKVSARDAEAMGMIYKAIPDADFEATVQRTAATLANMPTYGLALTKQAYNRGMTHTLDEQLQVEDELQTKAGQSRDYREGVTAFLEKRAPQFTGQ